MRIDTLFEFLTLSSNLSFTETAKSLFVSQSVLSSHISALEKELGVRLFVRDSHSVRLTEVGALFVEDAKRIVSDYERALSRIAHYQDGVSTTIRIGFLLGSFGSFLPLVCREYRRLHPDVEFTFKVLEVGNVQDALGENRIDIGFTLFSRITRGGSLSHRVLYEDEYKLAVPKTHRLASKASITFEDLKNETILAPRFNASRNNISQIEVKMRNAGISIWNDERIVEAASLMTTLTATGRIALAFDHLGVYGSGNLEFIPIEDDDVKLSAGMLWKKSRENDVILSFVNFLMSETARFEKKDYLSREGIDSLPIQ